MKEFNNEHLGKFLEIDNEMEPSKITKQEIVENDKTPAAVVVVRNEDIESDYDLRRKTLHDLVGTGQDALAHMMLVAKESDHPRAFEVVGQLMKTTSDMVADLTKLQIEMNKIESEKAGGPSKVVNNNSVFVGSTNELLEMLKGKNRE
tara:strand:- start:308 stop:751 length:444 start_codon:yes stop_codon:yes gene_type:complete